jgi:hypothetical protein
MVNKDNKLVIYKTDGAKYYSIDIPDEITSHFTNATDVKNFYKNKDGSAAFAISIINDNVVKTGGTRSLMSLIHIGGGGKSLDTVMDVFELFGTSQTAKPAQPALTQTASAPPASAKQASAAETKLPTGKIFRSISYKQIPKNDPIDRTKKDDPGEALGYIISYGIASKPVSNTSTTSPSYLYIIRVFKTRYYGKSIDRVDAINIITKYIATVSTKRAEINELFRLIRGYTNIN